MTPPDAQMTVGPIAEETAQFWATCGNGQLTLRWCTACDRPHHYPRTLCPFCLGETEWRNASGYGEIYAFSIQRRVPEEFAVGYVKLDEGVMMLTRLVGAPFDEMRIGQRVQVLFVPSTDGLRVPVFQPA